jgi:hypothetical protein
MIFGCVMVTGLTMFCACVPVKAEKKRAAAEDCAKDTQERNAHGVCALSTVQKIK